VGTNTGIPTSPVRVRSGRVQVWALGGAAALLLVTGWGHRLLVAEVDKALGQVQPLLRPLDTLPLHVGEWDGQDVPLDARVREAAHFDDFYVNRVYTHRLRGTQLEVFVGYVGRPRARMGHRPDVCFVAHGWEPGEQQTLAIDASGRDIPAILYEFRQPVPPESRQYVLATYVINGRFVQDPETLRRANTRGAQLVGERPAYLARLQVALLDDDREHALQELEDFAGRLAGPLAEIMPYWQKQDPS
jgi:hypothetical protein